MWSQCSTATATATATAVATATASPGRPAHGADLAFAVFACLALAGAVTVLALRERAREGT